MREIKVNLYQFNELSDAAKEKARQWWRDCENETFGQEGEFFYDPYQTAAKLLGIEFATHPVRLMSGKDRYDPKIWWCLHVQGCGASFEGSYRYEKECAAKVRKEFPADKALHAIADGLTELQKQHGYKLTATIKTDGREVHKYAMSADVYKDDDELGWDDKGREIADAVLALMRDFADWIYRRIDEEYDSRMEDEYVDDAITANEYEFYEDGRRAD